MTEELLPQQATTVIESKAQWFDSASWPVDTEPVVFLFRYIEERGREAFPGTWDPWDPIYEPIRSNEPDIEALKAEELASLCCWLVLNDVGYSEAFLESLQFAKPGPERLERAWSARDAINGAADRFKTVSTALHTEFRAGAIKTLARPVPGGAFEDCDPSLWNTEQVGQRFSAGIFDLNDPYVEAVYPHDEGAPATLRYIFVRRPMGPDGETADTGRPAEPGLAENSPGTSHALPVMASRSARLDRLHERHKQSAPDTRLNTAEAADYCGISKSSLDKKRGSGDGPAYEKIGRRVVYKLEELNDWLEQRKRTSTSSRDK